MSTNALLRPVGPSREPPPHHEIRVPADPMFQRLLSGLPPEVAATLSATQLTFLAIAVKGLKTHHLVEYRVSVPIGRKRYYATFYFGPERRSRERLEREGQTQLASVSLFYFVVLIAITGAATLAAGALLYVVKSALGIDLFDGPSVLHGLFF